MLEIAWFILWGVLWAVYFALDGFDLGLGMLSIMMRDETEKQTLYRAMGPFWDGNEVWFIAAGGVTFAAFPAAYATLFSALYAPLMFVLFALIMRGVSIEFRNQLPHVAWRTFWDACLVASSITASFLFGLIFANLFAGIPVGPEGEFQGSILDLFNPYGLIGGLLFAGIFVMHGMLWLVTKSEGLLRQRMSDAATQAWPVLLVVTLAFFAMTALATNLAAIYLARPVLFLLPIVAVGACIAVGVYLHLKSSWSAWCASALFIAGGVMTGVVGMYPNLIHSSVNPAFSVTVAGAASSPLTLKIMLVVALVFVPVVIAYQAWVYWLFRERITDKDTMPGGHY